MNYIIKISNMVLRRQKFTEVQVKADTWTRNARQRLDQIKTHERLEMLIDGGDFFPDREQGVGSSNEGSVISHCHLLHLPLYPLRIHTQ